MKRLVGYLGFTIYEARKPYENNGYRFAAFKAGTSPKFDDAEWQSNSDKEIREWIENYEPPVKPPVLERALEYDIIRNW